MVKQIFKYEDVKDKVLRGLDLIADPIRQTMSPKGGDALIETEHLSLINTNDGVTIAKNIQVADQIENSIIDIVKSASLRTNSEAGDGTSTTVLLSQVLTKEALKLKESGMSRLAIKKSLIDMAEKVKSNIKSKEVKTDKDLLNIAMISSNNDEDIAKVVVDVIKTAGEDGMVFLEPNNSPETRIEKDLGFMVKDGLLYQELMVDKGRPVVTFEGVPVLITDKRLYYPEEAETILRTAIQAGYSELVIVARDFIGKSVPTFIKNHQEGVIKVILVKDSRCTEDDNSSLDDLAQYLGGKLITDKSGSLVNNLSPEDFVTARKVYQDPQKTLFTPVKESKALKERIAYLKEELEKDKENKEIKSRLASLTSGVVTVYVGGNTNIEIREKVYRYEDAVNATRAAIRKGYSAGGGVSLLRAYSPDDYEGEMINVAKKFTQAVTRQIAQNCGKHDESVIEDILSKKGDYGYNAFTDSYGDLLKEGVIDPTLVLNLAIDNSVSVANTIVGINTYIINDLDYLKENDKDKK